MTHFLGDQPPITVGAVGLGYWGPNLARAWNGIPESNLKWLCDLDGALLDKIGSQYPAAQRTRSYEDLLNDSELDAISIATSVPTHFPLAAAAIRAGKHVFVEKPMAMNAREARLLEKMARDEGVQLVVGHLLVHHPGVETLRNLLSTQEFGRMRYIYTNRVNLGKVRADENALWSLGPHDVAVVLDLMGEMPESVSAQGQCFLRDGVEDVVFALLRFPGGQMAHMHMSWLDPHKMRRVTVVGSEKMAVFDDMSPDQKITVHDKGVSGPGLNNGPLPAGYAEALHVRYGDTHIPRISTEEPLRIQCRKFTEVVRGVSASRAGAEHGVAVVEILEALQNSLEQGGASVKVDTSVLMPRPTILPQRRFVTSANGSDRSLAVG